MDKKLVIKGLEKTRESLLEYGVSTEQLKAINYAIKTFKNSSDLELLSLEAEHMALVYGENSTTIYDKLINTLRHVNREDIMKCAFINKLKQTEKEIENLTPWDEGLVEMYDVLEILDKLIEEYEREE